MNVPFWAGFICAIAIVFFFVPGATWKTYLQYAAIGIGVGAAVGAVVYVLILLYRAAVVVAKFVFQVAAFALVVGFAVYVVAAMMGVPSK